MFLSGLLPFCPDLSKSLVKKNVIDLTEICASTVVISVNGLEKCLFSSRLQLCCVVLCCADSFGGFGSLIV